MQILTGHVSQETAFTISGYPYGGYRTQKRYWLDCHKTHGVRMLSQTLNPKTRAWNKPKTSGYSRFGMCMYLDDAGHVQSAGLTEYTSGAEAKDWRDLYGEGVPPQAQALMHKWVAAKVAYDANRKQADALDVGLQEARRGFVEGKVS